MEKIDHKWIGKTVMSKEGIPIGKIKNLLSDEIEDATSVILEPLEDNDKIEILTRNNDGDFVCPSHKLSQVKDTIILEDRFE
ncbi:MAG: hypothetical protein V5A64_03100 [Candidatus Thermoplasmatota archaeon]